MALRGRESVAVGAPDGGSTWADAGEAFTIAGGLTTTTATTGGVTLPVTTISKPNSIVYGYPSPDYVQPGGAFQSLYGFQISTVAAMAAASNLSLYFQVQRNIGIGVPIVGGVAITTFTPAQALVAPLASGQTIVLTNAAGNTQNIVTSASVPALAQIIPINSVTPANSYVASPVGDVVGSSAITLVGNAGLFGWLAAAAGTPAIPANSSIVTPALTNIALVTLPQTTTPFLPLQLSDQIQLVLITASSTATVQILNSQSLIS
jgi:hypothetical protein